jgi:integrase
MPTLTKRVVDAQKAGDRDYLVWDSRLTGFGLRVWPSGRKAFFVQYRDASAKSRRYQLGIYGKTTTAEKARNDARRWLGIARDPNDALHVQRAKARAKSTAPNVRGLADLFLDHIATRRRRTAKQRTIREYRRLIDQKILPAIGETSVDAVTRRDIESLLAKLSERPATANNVHAILGAMFAYAIRRELRNDGKNPCVGWERHERKRRSQSLSPEQYTALGRALAVGERDGLPVPPHLKNGKRGMSSERRAKLTGRKRGPYKRDAEQSHLTPANPIAVAVLRFLALTGWREGEALTLRRETIDVHLQVARLPETKIGRSIRPLGKAALAIIEPYLRRPTVENPYVFPGYRTGEHWKETKRLWLAVKHAAGVEVRLHDLRHSFTTVGRELNYADSIIAGLVGHVLEGMTSRYGDVPEATLRDAADRISETIANRLRGTSPAAPARDTSTPVVVLSHDPQPEATKPL